MRELDLGEISIVSGGSAEEPVATMPSVLVTAPRRREGPSVAIMLDWNASKYGGELSDVQYGGGGSSFTPPDTPCTATGGHDTSDYPDGVDPVEMGELAWDAYEQISNIVGENNQEGLMPIYQTHEGNLITGDMILGAIAPDDVAPSVNVTPGMLTINAPGELVGLVHNHPHSDQTALSPADENWFGIADHIAFQNIDDNLVLYVGADVVSGSASEGWTETPTITAHTQDSSGNQSSANIAEDGTSTACSA